jgi:hypothetical protein
MEEKSPCRILKRPCTAQVVQTVLLKQSANFSCALWRRLCGRQPALHFRSEIVRRSNGIRLHACVTKKLKQFAERKCADVRRIAQDFPAVLICGTLGMFAGVNVLRNDRAASAANAHHFAQHLQRIHKMMQREPAHNYVERPIFERKVLRISRTERNIGNATLSRALFSDREHGIRQVDANNFSRSASESFRDVSRTSRDIQHPLVTGEMGGGDQAPNALLVGDPWISGKSLGLCRERFPNDVVMLRHGKSLAQALAMRGAGSFSPT